MGQRTVRAGVFAAALLLALAGRAPAAEPPAKETAAPGTLRILAKARQMSTYKLGTRFEVGTGDITFEAPAAYKSGFDYWASSMRGRSEARSATS